MVEVGLSRAVAEGIIEKGAEAAKKKRLRD